MIKKVLLASIFLLISQLVYAQPDQVEKFREGTHYFKLNQATAPATDDSIEVTVVFSYLCSHCNTLDPYVESWAKRKPANVKLNRIHVDFGGASSLFARGYIAAEMTGVADASHGAMMDAIWKHQRRFRNAEQLADFYTSFGVEKERYLASFNSFALDSQLRKNLRDVKLFGITGTPMIVVNRKYRVPNIPSVMDVVDFLVAKETATQ